MATTSFHTSALSTRRTFLVKVKENLVNSENNENLSNYQLLKQKPPIWSISLHFSIFLTIVQLYFAWHRFLQWFQLKFRAGHFPGRDRVRAHCACSCVWPSISSYRGRPSSPSSDMFCSKTSEALWLSWTGFIWTSSYLFTRQNGRCSFPLFLRHSLICKAILYGSSHFSERRKLTRVYHFVFNFTWCIVWVRAA